MSGFSVLIWLDGDYIEEFVGFEIPNSVVSIIKVADLLLLFCFIKPHSDFLGDIGIWKAECSVVHVLGFFSWNWIDNWKIWIDSFLAAEVFFSFDHVESIFATVRNTCVVVLSVDNVLASQTDLTIEQIGINFKLYELHDSF